MPRYPCRFHTCHCRGYKCFAPHTFIRRIGSMARASAQAQAKSEITDANLTSVHRLQLAFVVCTDHAFGGFTLVASLWWLHFGGFTFLRGLGNSKTFASLILVTCSQYKVLIVTCTFSSRMKSV